MSLIMQSCFFDQTGCQCPANGSIVLSPTKNNHVNSMPFKIEIIKLFVYLDSSCMKRNNHFIGQNVSVNLNQLNRKYVVGNVNSNALSRSTSK